MNNFPVIRVGVFVIIVMYLCTNSILRQHTSEQFCVWQTIKVDNQLQHLNLKIVEIAAPGLEMNYHGKRWLWLRWVFDTFNLDNLKLFFMYCDIDHFLNMGFDERKTVGMHVPCVSVWKFSAVGETYSKWVCIVPERTMERILSWYITLIVELSMHENNWRHNHGSTNDKL